MKKCSCPYSYEDCSDVIIKIQDSPKIYQYLSTCEEKMTCPLCENYKDDSKELKRFLLDIRDMMTKRVLDCANCERKSKNKEIKVFQCDHGICEENCKYFLSTYFEKHVLD